MTNFIITLLYATFILNDLKSFNHKFVNKYKYINYNKKKKLNNIPNYNNPNYNIPNYNNLNNSNKSHNYIDDFINSKIAMASYPLVFNFPKF
tara:strand:- start:585 stop:860 length:276 start_codon:yes stop_codon:yes gene_type:complete